MHDTKYGILSEFPVLLCVKNDLANYLKVDKHLSVG